MEADGDEEAEAEVKRKHAKELEDEDDFFAAEDSDQAAVDDTPQEVDKVGNVRKQKKRDIKA